MMNFLRCDIRHILVQVTNNLHHTWLMVLVVLVESLEFVLQLLDLVLLTYLNWPIATAQADSAPMIAVTGQVPVAYDRKRCISRK